VYTIFCVELYNVELFPEIEWLVDQVTFAGVGEQAKTKLLHL